MGIDEELASAKAALTQGDNNVFLADDNSVWRNGDYECRKIKCVDENDRVTHVAFVTDPRAEDFDERGKCYYEVKVVKGVPRVTNHRGFTVKHQKIGAWDLIVFRNAAGGVVDVLIASSAQLRYGEEMLDMQAMLNGVWVSARGDTATLGKPLERGSLVCPGEYYLEKVDDGWKLAFAQNRMKVVRMPDISKEVDPNTGEVIYYADGKRISKDEFEFIASRPTGYGGHGALLGPIVWSITPTADGKQIKVNLDEPYNKDQDFRYSPFDEEQFTLSWVRSLYPGMKGRWAVASVRPLTRRMLSNLNKAALRQILADIASRHPKGTGLTAVEKLNKSLITTMLVEK